MKRLLIFLLCALTALSSTSIAASAVELQSYDDNSEEAVFDSDTSIASTGATADELAPVGYSLVSESEFQSKLSSLRSRYPNGSIWEGVYYEGGYARAWTCFAYAVKMMYEVFGARYYTDRIYDYTSYSYSGICAGDIVRIDGDSHSIFITKVTDSGYYYTDGNGTGVYNQVRWDGYYSNSEMRSRFTYKVHLPGNSLTGVGASHTIAYNANGGSGSIASVTVGTGEGFSIKENGFSRPGYRFAGFIVKRSFDDKWFTSGGTGWQTQSDIYNSGYYYSFYYPGENYKMSSNWLGSHTSSSTFTFYAQWLPDVSTVEFYSNYSGYNYILGSDLDKGYNDYIYSRNSSVYSVEVDESERLNNAASLKITGKKAGSSGDDLAFNTSTNRGYGYGYSQAGIAGDDKDMTMHFYAKASVSGAKMYLRWGYSSEYTTITLTDKWKVYSVALPKTRFYGCTLHPYFDKAGTYYLNSLALGDSLGTTNVVPETGSLIASQEVERGGKLSSMPVPVRDGYEFLGWFTAAEGGSMVTSDSTINESTLRLYAHWRKEISDAPVKTARYNGHIYELYDNIMGWEDAESFCTERGGHLISIGSDGENAFAHSMIDDRQGYCWIGLRYISSSDDWSWVDGCTSLDDYDAWFDSSFGEINTGEHYGLLYPMDFGVKEFSGTWDKCFGSGYYSSYYGYYNSFFICEYISGDADGDGEITIADATYMQRSLAALPVVDAFKETIADIDGDDSVSIMDVTWLQRSLAEISTPYTVG